MSKIISVGTTMANALAPRIIRTPGVGGYAARFIANHVDQPAGSTVAQWNSVSGSVPTTLVSAGGTSTVTLAVENGIQHLHSPGDSSAGGRLLGAHTAQRPVTYAAVIRAATNISPIVGMEGSSLGRNSTGNYKGTNTNSAYTTVTHDGWTFVMFAQASDTSFIVRADATEATQATGAAPVASFGGIFFGATSAGQAVDIRELIYWPTQLSATDRTAVHTYMKSRYPELL